MDTFRTIKSYFFNRPRRTILLSLLTALGIYMLSEYHRANIYLLEYSQTIVTGEEQPSEMAIKFADHIRNTLIAKRNKGSFLSPVFRFLRPTAVQVCQSGGDCADKARLLIVLLDLYGVEATKVALYDDSGKPRHATVEVKIENGGKMAIDPYYSLYFPRPQGGYYSIADVSANDQILRARIDEIIARGNDQRRPRFSNYPYHKYTYRQPRTINWDKSVIMESVYHVLSVLIGSERVDQIERPSFVERPPLMLFLVVFSSGMMIFVLYVPPIDRRLKRMPVIARFRR